MTSTQDARSAGDSALQKQHYEVWASTRTNGNIVGRAHTLLGALTLYIRARRAERDRTVSLLESGSLPDRRAMDRSA